MALVGQDYQRRRSAQARRASGHPSVPPDSVVGRLLQAHLPASVNCPGEGPDRARSRRYRSPDRRRSSGDRYHHPLAKTGSPFVVASVLCPWSRSGRCRSEHKSRHCFGSATKSPRTLRCCQVGSLPRPGSESVGSHLDRLLPCGRRGRLRVQPSGVEVDAWMQVDPAYNDGERWGWSNVCNCGRAGAERERLTGRQESVSLTHLRSEVTWENGSEHSGSRWFADTLEVIKS